MKSPHVKNNLHFVAKEFGLSPEQFAEHVKDEFPSHEILQASGYNGWIIQDNDTFIAYSVGISLD